MSEGGIAPRALTDPLLWMPAILNLPEGKKKKYLINLILTRWSEVDPVAATRYVDGAEARLIPERMRGLGKVAGLAHLENADQVLTVIQPGVGRDAFISGVTEGLACRNMIKATTWIGKLGTVDDRRVAVASIWHEFIKPDLSLYSDWLTRLGLSRETMEPGGQP